MFVGLTMRPCLFLPGLVAEAGVAFQEAVRNAPEPQLAVNPTPGADKVGSHLLNPQNLTTTTITA